MNILRKLLLITIVIMVLIAAYGFFVMPAQYKIERSVTINAPITSVYSVVNDLKRWPDWVVWWKKDPDLYFTYGIRSVGEGAEVEWGSKSQGSGYLTLVSSIAPSSVSYEIKYAKADEVTNGRFELSEANAKTVVRWIDDIDLGYNPYFRYLGFFIDGMVGDSFEAGLLNLKELMES